MAFTVALQAATATGCVDGGSSNNEQEKVNGRERSNDSRAFKDGCFRTQADEKGSFDMEADSAGDRLVPPRHLVVMVNGIIGSARNWRYAANQLLKKYPEDIVVHCSECNHSMMTFDGVDVMGDRLAEEVMSVINHHPCLEKISFVAHSLGGLTSRYAIARLYKQGTKREHSQQNGDSLNHESGDPCQDICKEKIGGLEPMNFITVATPHLGSRWHKQVPIFGGFYSVEKVAASTSWFLGRTLKHLFLTDNDYGKPLLLHMVSDHADLKFISALQSFKRHVAYANVRYDHLVGWNTSSIRRQNELPKEQHHFSTDNKYPHIVNVERTKMARPQEETHLEDEGKDNNGIDMEEEMIRGLTKMSWERVDVNFSGSKQRFLAHSTIQVKNYFINSDGADVIEHIIDHFLL